VAEKKPGRRAQKGGTPEPDYTTFRVFADDGEDISDLARLMGKTIAEVYRELCAPLIRGRRVKLLREQLSSLEGE
jgi:hypothetical protein